MTGPVPGSPLYLDGVTHEVTSILPGTPDTVLEIERASGPAYFTGATFSNQMAPGTAVQMWVGVLVLDSGAWTPQISIYLDGGEFTTWSGKIQLSQGDALVAYADVAARGTFTPELEYA